MEKRKSAHMVLMGKFEGKRPLGRSVSRLEDNIKTGLQGIKWAAWKGLIWLWTGTGCGLL
jgi:hypothetical protein